MRLKSFTCPVCGKHRANANHETCSKKLQSEHKKDKRNHPAATRHTAKIYRSGKCNVGFIAGELLTPSEDWREQ